ncbi:synaptotagmin-8 isoform X6 [Sciurus carolinensis]|uniref:synaptotagmin-8 isoform X6 n=1 Tax=Sciurus carolinensis TaxID=30640 RepID=UPI001FB432AD|nr:synaptotagmin-8 isoform X6 [Sciurus carolinensis]
MGHPPGPPSAPAPAGTTALPGLTPDLVAQTPWPRWALVLVALAAGVLTVSCLLWTFCCRCRRRHKKHLRDKEAVGLGSARSSTTTHLVQPDVDKRPGTLEDPRQWGRLQLSLEYDLGSQEIRVGLKQAADLRARGTADPYARVSVSTQARHGHETKVHRGTLCPVFEETCCFHVSLGRAAWVGQGQGQGQGPTHRPAGRSRRQSCPGPHCRCGCWTSSPSRSTSPSGNSVCRWGPWIRSMCWSVGTSWAPRGPERALREGPAHGEPEEMEEEKDLCQESHGHPLLQRGLHLPGALQPGPERGPGAGRLGPWSAVPS